MTLPSGPQLSAYQLGVLHETATADVPVFLLPLSNKNDSASQRKMLDDRREEVKDLLKEGLIEDVSKEFKAHIADQIKRTGRRFQVFGLSEMGFLMFKDGIPESVN